MKRNRMIISYSHFAFAGKSGLRFFLLIFLVAFGSHSISQDFKKQFNKAKEQFANGNYSAAMDGFNPIIVYDKNNSYSEYASFYYAVSAQRLGFNTLAKSQFAHLRKTYPKWNQLDEVDLWLAKLYFEEHDYFQAMSIFREIKNKSLHPQLDSLKRFYLSAITDVETLKMIREENPNDIETERALAKAIGKKGFTSLDKDIFDSLMTKHHWNQSEFMVVDFNRSIKKDRYQVAILFPFRASTLEPSPEKKKNQPILDLYQGIKLAIDSLNKAGILIDLLVYDTERDTEVTKKILTLPELKGVDLIIGPLFADEGKEVQAFSKENSINLVINPVSSNSDFILNNPFSILYQPSHETIGSESADVVLSESSNKNSIVYFGDSPKDSIMAFNYMKRAKELGINVVYAEEVRKETSARILERLAKATKFDEWKNPLEFTMKLDSVGSIFVASDNPVIYTKIINSVESRGDSILVVGQESWLEDNSVEYVKFESTGVIFATPNFSPVKSMGAIDFRNKYLHKHGLLPPDNAKKGYEMMMNLGRAINKYGCYFQDQLLVTGTLEGVLTAGFKFQATRDNGLLPFVRFHSGELIRIK